jgi:Flp pilus assembly protein TadD
MGLGDQAAASTGNRHNRLKGHLEMSLEERFSKEDTAQLNRRREEAFRPNRILGYNHNTLAMYLIERGAYTIAESELRRAIWLNPYEPAFMANLAWCLHKQKRDDEALQCQKNAMEQNPDNKQVRQVAALLNADTNPMDAPDNDEK